MVLIIFFSTVYLQWGKRGIWNGNIIADELAKKAVNQYIINKHNYQNEETAISMEMVKKYFKMKWKILKTEQITNIKRKSVISQNMDIWEIYSEEQPIKWDMKQFDREGYGKLTKLRTEHIPLNWYYHVRKHYNEYKMQMKQYGYIKYKIECNKECCGDCNNGYCKQCDKIETVYHYLIACKKYNNLREFYIQPLKQIILEYENTISLKRILFPPINAKWHHRKMILSNIINYCKLSKRFY